MNLAWTGHAGDLDIDAAAGHRGEQGCKIADSLPEICDAALWQGWHGKRRVAEACGGFACQTFRCEDQRAELFGEVGVGGCENTGFGHEIGTEPEGRHQIAEVMLDSCRAGVAVRRSMVVRWAEQGIIERQREGKIASPGRKSAQVHSPFLSEQTG